MSSIEEVILNLRQKIDDVEMDLFSIRQRITTKKEDLDIASDALINNLQLLKSLDAKLVVEKNLLKEAEVTLSNRGDYAFNQDENENEVLEKLLQLSNRPWEYSSNELKSTSLPGYEKAVLGELSRLAALMNSLKDKLADPFEKDRHFSNLLTNTGSSSSAVSGGNAKRTVDYGDSENNSNWGKSGNKTDTITVVMDNNVLAVVKINLTESTSFINIIEYCASYWSLDMNEYTLVDVNGTTWPLKAKVRETLLSMETLENVFYLKKGMHKGDDDIDDDIDDDVEQFGSMGERVSNLSGNTSTNNNNNNNNNDSLSTINEKKKQLRFLDDVNEFSKAVSTNKTDANESKKELHFDLGVDRLKLEDRYHRGYRYSLGMVRSHLEIFLYLFLVTLVFISTFITSGAYESQPQANVVRNAFFNIPFPHCSSDCSNEREISFQMIDRVNGFYDWLNGPVVELLMVDANKTINNNNDDQDNRAIVQQYNYLLGKVFLQQLRVQPSCLNVVPHTSGDKEPSCYPSYEVGTKSTKTYGNISENSDVSSAFVYKDFPTEKERDEMWPGFVSDYIYGVGDRFPLLSDGGFTFSLSNTKDEAREQVRQLRDGNWIDYQTRAIFVCFNLFNPNTNFATVVTATFQFTTSSGVVTRSVINPLQQNEWLITNSGELGPALFRIALWVYLVFFILFLVDFIRAKQRREFLRKPESVVDIILAVIVIILVGFMLSFEALVENVFLDIKQNGLDIGADFIDMRGVAFGQSAIRSLQAATVILLLVKALTLLRTNPHISLLGRAFSGSASMYANFIFVYCVFLIAFTCAGFFLFGRVEQDFYSFDLALFSIFRIMLGGYDLSKISPLTKNRMTPVVFAYVVYLVGFLILYRIFIAITAFGFSKQMDSVRKKGYYWLPSVNLEYRMRPADENKRLRRLKLTDRYKDKDV